MKTRIEHPIKEHEGEWIEVGPLSIEFRERWRELKIDADARALVPEACSSWHLLDAAGEPLPQPQECMGTFPKTLPIESDGWLIHSIGKTINERSQLFLASAKPSEQ